MGAWGIDTFDNDDASDWVYDLEKLGPEYLRETLERVLSVGDAYLGAGLANVGLAACEVVARLRKSVRENGSVTEQEEVDAWIESQDSGPDPEWIRMSVRVIERVLGEESELAQLWADSGEGSEWRAGVESLRQRLAAGEG